MDLFYYIILVLILMCVMQEFHLQREKTMKKLVKSILSYHKEKEKREALLAERRKRERIRLLKYAFCISFCGVLCLQIIAERTMWKVMQKLWLRPKMSD